MRQPTTTEIFAVNWFAERLSAGERAALLNDLDNSTAQVLQDEQLIVRFELRGYTRPTPAFDRLLPVDACVSDRDGARLSVVLSTDQNGRLFELRVIRFEQGPVLGPDWSTLRLSEPGEVVELNTASTPLKIQD
jgi:hypothetical protein